METVAVDLQPGKQLGQGILIRHARFIDARARVV
jgi:hypothetical protein